MFWSAWKRDKAALEAKKPSEDRSAAPARSAADAPASSAAKLDSLPPEHLPRTAKPRILIWAKSVPESDLLKTRLRALTIKFDLHFTSSAEDINRLANAGGCDGVIVALTTEKGSEVDFLRQIIVIRPGAFRLVRAADRKLIQVLGNDPFTHHVPLDPEPETWENILDRCVLMRTWMETPSLKSLIGKMRKLPTLPRVYTRVVDELNSPEASLAKVAEIVAEDPVVTAKLIQLVNSSFFGLKQPIVSPTDAVMFLGADRVKGLILVARVFSQFDAKQIASLELDQLWNHAMKTGAYAQSIAKWEAKDPRVTGTAFTAGLLHDVGKLMLAGNLPDEYRSVIEISKRDQIPICAAEMQVFGTTHAELGGVLMGLWGLPLELVQSVGWHHAPDLSGDRKFTVLTAVHAANAIASESGEGGARKKIFDADYLAHVGLSDRRNQWRQVCGIEPDPKDDAVAGKSKK